MSCWARSHHLGSLRDGRHVYVVAIDYQRSRLMISVSLFLFLRRCAPLALLQLMMAARQRCAASTTGRTVALFFFSSFFFRCSEQLLLHTLLRLSFWYSLHSAPSASSSQLPNPRLAVRICCIWNSSVRGFSIQQAQQQLYSSWEKKSLFVVHHQRSRRYQQQQHLVVFRC